MARDPDRGAASRVSRSTVLSKRRQARAFLTALQNAMANLYAAPRSAVRVGVAAGLLEADMVVRGSARDVWFGLVEQARKHNVVATLVQIARDEYVEDQQLRDLANQVSSVDLASLRHSLPVAVMRAHWLTTIVVVAGAITATFVLSLRSSNADEQLARLYGYVHSQSDSTPLQDVVIRVETARGVDVTRAGQWLSDSDGFYLVETARPIGRNASIVAWIPGCRTANRLSLDTDFETRVDLRGNPVAAQLKPVFNHGIGCAQESK